MSDPLYVAATGMHALQQTLDNAAHNAVNSSTPGFQRHRVVLQNFSSLLENAANRGNLIAAKEFISFEQGELVNANGPYAAAIEGKGFFSVRDANDNEYYTRNGDFTADLSGRLITRAGYAVEGENGPITIDPALEQARIDAQGRVTQGGTEIGRLKVVEFSDADRDRLVPASDTLFRAPEGVDPETAAESSIRHGLLEMPKFTAPMALVQMLLANRNYEAIQRTMRTVGETHENLLRAIN